jgi:hypothetical protein
MVWPTAFDPPPPKGPPPKIPLPKTPTQAEMRNAPLSPLSKPDPPEYFKKVNYSPTTPPRVPPKTNVRAPLLHRLSETDSIDEIDTIDPVPGPRFRGPTSGSPVSPYTILEQDPALPVPTAFDLDKASGSGRKGSESSTGTLASQQSFPYLSRGRSMPYDDEEPTPFVMKSDKHKRILGIESKSPASGKRGSHKGDNANSTPSGPRRKRSFPDINRSNSPLPAPDVVPFLYQDIEVVPLSFSVLTF